MKKKLGIVYFLRGENGVAAYAWHLRKLMANKYDTVIYSISGISDRIEGDKRLRFNDKANDLKELQSCDILHLMSVSENGSRKQRNENAHSRLYPYLDKLNYFVTVHSIDNDLRLSLDRNFVLAQARGIILTSNNNKKEYLTEYKNVHVLPLPFVPYNMANKPEKKVVNISRFISYKKQFEFVQIAKILPQYKFVIWGKVYNDEERKQPVNGMMGKVYEKRIMDFIKDNKLENVEILNKSLNLSECLNEAIAMVDLSFFQDRDRPQYTTLEAIEHKVIPIIHPNYSGRLRNEKECLTAVTPEDAANAILQIDRIGYDNFVINGEKYLKEYTSSAEDKFSKVYESIADEK